MRTYPAPARRGRMVVLALVAGLVLAGCGADDTATSDDVTSINQGPQDSQGDQGDQGDQGETGSPAPTDDSAVLIGTLPDPEPGVIRIDGAKNSLASRANPAYLAESTNRIEQETTGESRAFQRLCVGDVDLVDSARPITAAEWEGCRAQGLDIVQFQVAADAVVLAIKNETDVGGDCLDTTQIGAIFGVGSTITNWSQVGANFDDVPLRTGGPDLDSGELRFFGRYILNSPDPSLSNFSASYRTFSDDAGIRDYVAGSPDDQLASDRYLPTVEPRRNQFRLELQQKLRVLADAREEVAVAVREQTKGIRDQRTPAARAADDARVRRAYAAQGAAITEVNRIRAIYGPLDERYQRLRAAGDRVEAAVGALGIFPQSYYELYENLLRPFEVQVADDDGELNCIFPSPQTIVSGQYPLSRQLLLTTTTRSLKRPEVADYLTFYLRNSQVLAEASQSVALPAEDVRTQLTWIADSAYPTFASVDGGPVEVQEAPVQGIDEPDPLPMENPAR